MSSAGEFGRVKRAGDYMKGALDHRSQLVEWTDGAGYRYSGIRHTGDDLELYDKTVGVWVSLSALMGVGPGAIQYEEIVATAGQTVFPLTTIVYTPGTHTMQVVYQGQHLLHSWFTETDAATVTLNSPPVPLPVAGNILAFYVIKTAPATDETLKARATDTTQDFLDAKIAVAGSLTKAILNPGGNEQVELTAPTLSNAVPITDGVGAPGVSVDTARPDHVHPDDSENQTFTPAAAGNWAAPPPATIKAAIDRIAAALATHLGVPIP